MEVFASDSFAALAGRALSFMGGAASAAFLSISLGGCGGASESLTASDAGGSHDAQGAPSSDAGTPVSPASDAAVKPPPSDDSGSPTSSDDSGPPAMRNATCTPLSAQTGTIVNSTHGRLDGTLVYVVPVGGSGKCNGDESHVHLQVEVTGLVYDVAVDIGSLPSDEVGLYTETIPVPSGTWTEGWHATDDLSYPSLSLSSTQFPIADPSAVASQVVALLDSVSKVSIFCEGYTEGNGCHDVHYVNGNAEDGAIVLDPTSATSPVLFFRFQGQTF
jgi:hypothetical protein